MWGGQRAIAIGLDFFIIIYVDFVANTPGKHTLVLRVTTLTPPRRRNLDDAEPILKIK
jgi:hypothetical protein